MCRQEPSENYQSKGWLNKDIEEKTCAEEYREGGDGHDKIYDLICNMKPYPGASQEPRKYYENGARSIPVTIESAE